MSTFRILRDSSRKVSSPCFRLDWACSFSSVLWTATAVCSCSDAWARELTVLSLSSALASDSAV